MELQLGSHTGPGPTTTSCPKCDSEASLTRRFCGQCGHLLWDPCLVCGELHPTGEKFCGACGEEANGPLDNVRQALRDAIARADAWAREGRFVDAVALLEEIDVAEHSHLQSLKTEIQERIERFPEARRQAIEQSRRVVGLVEALLQEHRHEEAHAELTRVPAAFRNREITDLLEKSTAKVSELRELRADVHHALKQRAYEDLLPKVERLADLSPHDQRIGKLRADLRDREARRLRKRAARQLQQAQAELASSDYRQARIALEQVPALANDDTELRNLLRATTERVWLAEQLRTEPYVTAAVRCMGQRLVQLQPHDQDAVEKLRELEVRWRMASDPSTSRPVPWVAPPQPSWLGAPTSLWHAPAIAGLPGEGKYPARRGLLVALGLALQGLGRAESALNLAPKDPSRSWLQRIGRREDKSAAQTAWGIDVGSRYLKAICVSSAPNRNGWGIAQTVILPIDRAHSHQGDPATGTEAVVEQFLKQHSLQDATVVVGLPGTSSLGRFFRIPAPHPAKFQDAVQYELKARIPLEADQLVYDYCWTEAPGFSEKGSRMRRVILVAADRKFATQRRDWFAQCGARRVELQCDCLAMANAIRVLEPQVTARGALAVLEVGAATSNFLFLSETSLWFRGLHWGSNNLDRAVAEKTRQTLQTAERYRLQPDKYPAMHELHALALPGFAALGQQLRQTLNRVENEISESASRIWITGAGSAQHGLVRYLQAGN